MKRLFSIVIYMVSGFVIGGLSLLIFQELNRPELRFWHTAKLDSEFSIERYGQNLDFPAYKRLENKLFNQLGNLTSINSSQDKQQRFNRFAQDSWSNPQRFARNWNKSYELTPEKPESAVLLLHGLSDSPYSLRAIGEKLYQDNSYVLGLRLPGHGTIPASLTTVQWQDFSSSVRLAMRYLKDQGGQNIPIYIVGYSNGAALALEYTLSVLEGEQMPRPAGLVLISPAVSVSPLAAFAKWKLMLSRVPGLSQLAWLSVEPEYDPYKYNSFAVNAGVQIHLLTKRIAGQISHLDDGTGIKGFPPTLAFISAADATIPPTSLTDDFMIHLTPGGHKMMLFDINREADSNDLLKKDPLASFNHLFSRPLPFDVNVITNKSPSTRELVEKIRTAETMLTNTKSLSFSWPRDIYALSHVALPFPPTDPVYGIPDNNDNHPFSLGSLEPRGEKNLLSIPIDNLMRLRYNPFYPLVESHISEWIQ